MIICLSTISTYSHDYIDVITLFMEIHRASQSSKKLHRDIDINIYIDLR